MFEYKNSPTCLFLDSRFFLKELLRYFYLVKFDVLN